MPLTTRRTIQPAPAQTLSRRPVLVMLILAAMLIAATAYASFRSGQASERAAEQLAISIELSQQSGALVSALIDAETGQRGFIITGDDAYLEPYRSGVAEVSQVLNRMDVSARTRPDQAERLRQIRPLIQDKLRELAESIGARRQKGLPAAQLIVDSDRGKVLMDQIRARMQDILAVADQRVLDFSAQAQKATSLMIQISMGGGLVLLLFMVAMGLTVMRSLVVREQLYHEAVYNAERFRVTLTSIGDGVIATDETGSITFLNPVAEALTGWKQEEALGRHVGEVFHIVNETSRARVENPVEKALKSGVIVGLANHTVLISKSGREVPIDDSGAPIRSLDDTVEGAILVFQDISDRHEAQQKLQAANLQLREFVDGAAHDLRGSLRTIGVWTELLERQAGEKLDDEARKFLGLMRGGVERMSTLLQDLLAYAQASHFEREDLAEAPLQEAFDLACENLKADLTSTAAQVTAGPLPSLPMRRAHQVQLLQNLIGNAIKYRRDVPPVIHVACERRDGEWLLLVSDNGMGIAPEYQDLIFRPFKRLHGEDLPGTGIGLAICTKIVSGYGGRIWVTSKVGSGSTFFASIPAEG